MNWKKIIDSVLYELFNREKNRKKQFNQKEGFNVKECQRLNVLVQVNHPQDYEWWFGVTLRHWWMFIYICVCVCVCVCRSKIMEMILTVQRKTGKKNKVIKKEEFNIKESQR